jgi:GNAT superfamily N-acetyltransferase
VLAQSPEFTVVVDASVAHDRRVSVLTRDGELTLAVLAPEVADRLALPDGDALTEGALRQALTDAGITLHDADLIHYFTADAAAAVTREQTPTTVRLLTADDAEAFALFEASAPEQDLDDAYVELDHWAVVGAFEPGHPNGRLIAAASAYPWGESQLADLGVITLPDARGKGIARAVVRELARVIYSRGYEPQYRCQLDNAASIALAASAGLTRFGTWQTVSPD